MVALQDRREESNQVIMFRTHTRGLRNAAQSGSGLRQPPSLAEGLLFSTQPSHAPSWRKDDWNMFPYGSVLRGYGLSSARPDAFARRIV
jgi:hypothetical protein